MDQCVKFNTKRISCLERLLRSLPLMRENLLLATTKSLHFGWPLTKVFKLYNNTNKQNILLTLLSELAIDFSSALSGAAMSSETLPSSCTPPVSLFTLRTCFTP